MYYLLAFYALTGDILPEDKWGMHHKFHSIEACTVKRLEYQDAINKAWIKDKSKDESLIEFKCVLGKEMTV